MYSSTHTIHWLNTPKRRAALALALCPVLWLAACASTSEPAYNKPAPARPTAQLAGPTYTRDTSFPKTTLVAFNTVSWVKYAIRNRA
ncbi:MAG: hypothetical protein HC848_10340 [Limnobacter sp.]|nr:hypothetical protein [Limnobacter sp.]